MVLMISLASCVSSPGVDCPPRLGSDEASPIGASVLTSGRLSSCCYRRVLANKYSTAPIGIIMKPA